MKSLVRRSSRLQNASQAATATATSKTSKGAPRRRKMSSAAKGKEGQNVKTLQAKSLLPSEKAYPWILYVMHTVCRQLQSPAKLAIQNGNYTWILYVVNDSTSMQSIDCTGLHHMDHYYRHHYYHHYYYHHPRHHHHRLLHPKKRKLEATTSKHFPAASAKKSTKKQELPWQTVPRDLELECYQKGHRFVVGCDEAGRGPLAGPVVAAACHVPSDFGGFAADIVIKDSKVMSEAERERAFEALMHHPDITTSYHVVDNDRIDGINILASTLEAMEQSVLGVGKQLRQTSGADIDAGDPVPDMVFIDGSQTPKGLLTEGSGKQRTVTTVVKGDSRVFSVACASVVAKVVRDRLMLQHHKRWPEYGFDQHKGYGVYAHRAAIARLGPCDIHRLTFAPMKTMTKAQLRVSDKRWKTFQKNMLRYEKKKGAGKK